MVSLLSIWICVLDVYGTGLGKNVIKEKLFFVYLTFHVLLRPRTSQMITSALGIMLHVERRENKFHYWNLFNNDGVVSRDCWNFIEKGTEHGFFGGWELKLCPWIFELMKSCIMNLKYVTSFISYNRRTTFYRRLSMLPQNHLLKCINKNEPLLAQGHAIRYVAEEVET